MHWCRDEIDMTRVIYDIIIWSGWDGQPQGASPQSRLQHPEKVRRAWKVIFQILQDLYLWILDRNNDHAHPKRSGEKPSPRKMENIRVVSRCYTLQQEERGQYFRECPWQNLNHQRWEWEGSHYKRYWNACNWIITSQRDILFDTEKLEIETLVTETL